MSQIRYLSSLLLLFFIFVSSFAYGVQKIGDKKPIEVKKNAYVVRDGSVVKSENVATMPASDHYRQGIEAANANNWDQAVKHFNVVVLNFPKTSYGLDSNYHLGIAYYRLAEYDFANDAFSRYLSSQTNPSFFEEAIEYKFLIAEAFRKGAKRHFWGSKQMPKWASGIDLSKEIYDEVILALPNNDLAAKALFSKANLLFVENELRDSIESFQSVIKRFPKHEYAPVSYLRISKVYVAQSRKEFQNPDILALADINLKKFEEDFPKEERLEIVRCDLNNMKETHARGLYETGYFYERIKKPEAACLFYKKAIFDFPETTIADCCRKRINRLCPKLLENDKDFKISDSIDFSAANG